MGRCWALWPAGIARVAHRAAVKPLEISVLHGDGTNTGTINRAQAGDTPQTEGQGIAMADHRNAVVAPVPVAPVHETDIVLLPQGLNALKQAGTQVGAELRGASRNLDGGCDAARQRTGMFPARLIPNLTESPRQRTTTERGRKRRFDAAIHSWRIRVERILARKDTSPRWWRRVERPQQRHAGMVWLASEDPPASVLRCLTFATSAWPCHARTPPRTTAR
jgi:hypothetical protein